LGGSFSSAPCCCSPPLLQQEAAADVVVIGLLHPAVVHADDAAGVIGDGAAREGGDAAGASPFEDKRMNLGGPDPSITDACCLHCTAAAAYCFRMLCLYCQD
jgi:hypothetical protein